MLASPLRPMSPRRTLRAAVAAALLVSVSPLALPPVALARAAPEGFADLVEQVNPAVVQIVVKKATQPTPEGAPALPPGIPDGPFKEFFERFFNEHGRPPAGEFGAMGSGFVIDPGGVVVTNNHVVSDAREILVRVKDGVEYPATLVGADEKTDLAVLRIEPKAPLPAVRWGNSDAVRVGDWVVAVGNPFGLGGTVTAGIVSARGRDLGAGPYDDFLQIDASINTGNSGGPLFDVDGAVVGVNTAIFSPNGGNIGIGFAIPSDLAQEVVGQLREKGVVERGWLGVMIQPVTAEIAETLGLKDARGALVTAVTDDSPAAKAGLRQGDVVLTYDGKEINTLRDLSRAVADTAVGTEVALEIVRDQKSRAVQARIGELAREQVAAGEGEKEQEPASGSENRLSLARLGLTVSPLDSQSRARFGLAASVTGVVIAEVDEAASAAEKGLRPGDVITSVNQRPVTSPNELATAVEAAVKAHRKAVLLLIERDGEQRFVAVELADA